MKNGYKLTLILIIALTIKAHQLKPIRSNALIQLNSQINMKINMGSDSDDGDDPSEAKADTAHPEEVDVSNQDMSFYSDILSNGENIASLKAAVEKTKKPK